jgi:anti-sigma factor RsiW
MALKPACGEFVPHLSPLVDGELPPRLRTKVERHLSHCPDCTGRVTDLRAEGGLVRHGLELLTDDADFTGFAQKVMARVTPQRPPFWERLRITLIETWTYQRAALGSGLAVAAALLIIIPVGWQARNAAQASPTHLAVRSVTVDPSAHVAPVVFTNDQTGDAIIWLVDHDDHPIEGAAPGKEGHPGDEDVARPTRIPRETPSGGDL